MIGGAVLGATAARAAEALAPRPISATERAAVELAVRYLSEGAEAWRARLAPDSPWSALTPEEALREIEVRAGPAEGATWTLLTPAPGADEAVALFSVVFPSGADDTLSLRLEREAPGGGAGAGDRAEDDEGTWRIAELRCLADPAPAHEEIFFDPNPTVASTVGGPTSRLRKAAPLAWLAVLALLGAARGVQLLRNRTPARRPSPTRIPVPIPAPTGALVPALAAALLLLSCGAPAGRDAEPGGEPAASADGSGAEGAAAPSERLGALRDLRWSLATDGDPSALGDEIARVAPEGLPRQVADLWRAQLLLRQVDLHEAEEILGGMPAPGPVPLADLLRARLATARGAADDAISSYTDVRAAGPDHDNLRLEIAGALASFGLERQSEIGAIQVAEMGSRVAEPWYLKAGLVLIDGQPKKGEALLRTAWGERPILREELFGEPALATLVALPTLFPLIEPGSPEEPTVEPSDLGRRPVPLPADARATALGRLLRIEIARPAGRSGGAGGRAPAGAEPGLATGTTPGDGAVLEIPGGAELAPPGTHLAEAAEWKRHDQQIALARLDALTDQARGMTAFGQPRLRRQILEAAGALTEAERWDELVLLTDGIEEQVERVPAILGQLRALALRKTSRGAEARALLVRLAKASMESKRPAAGVLYQLAELLVSDREFDTALRLLRKASALSPLARNDARMQQIGLEQWLYDNQEKTWSDHFEIIYPRMTSPRYAELLGIVLEAERERISRWIPLRPGHPIEVDLFPLERFLRAHSGGVLVLGIYDGRVRVPFADLQSLHPRLVTVLSHEVAHALLAQSTYDRAPDWFHEGLAQHIEMMPGRINPIPDLAQRGRVISLPMIEAILDGFGEPQLVDLAYGEAAWVIHYLEAVHGVKTIRAFADAYSRGLSTEETIREVLDMSVAEFDRAVWDWCIDDAPPSWPTELVRYDRELEGLAKRGGDAREIVREARPDDRRPTMATWYQTYNRDVASFKSALRNILGPLSQGKVPKRIACVTLSGQVNRLLQDPEALHPPDATVEGALDTAFRHFAAMAQACSRGDTESAQASLTRAEQALGAAAHELKRYGMRP